MRNWRRFFTLLIAVMLIGCTTQPVAQQTFVLVDATPAQRVTLEITLQNARDQHGARRDGTLSITSLNDGQQIMTHITTTDSVAPVWLASANDSAVFVTENQERRVIDGQCTRDASGFPPVSMRDMLGPLQGFVRQNDTLQSTQGGPAWSRFTAQAMTNSQGVLTSMTGQGQGKVLLPGGDVITADITWQYTTDAYPVTIVAPTMRCESQAFDDLSFPAVFGTSTSMGGALLFSASGSLASFRDALVAHWQDDGFTPVISAEQSQAVTIEIIVAERQIIRAFLVQSSNQRVDITVIQIAP